MQSQPQQLELALFADTKVTAAVDAHGRTVPNKFVVTVKPPIIRAELTTKEAAAVIGCDDSTVRRWCREGIFTFRKKNRRAMLIPAEEVRAFMQPVPAVPNGNGKGPR